MPSSRPAHPAVISRRAALAAVGGGAAALLARPAWAVDGRRPGTLAAPALDAFDRQVVSRVSAERALAHIEALSEGIGPRIGGTASERAAADHLAGQLDALGYEVRLEPFGVADTFLGEITGSPALPDDLCWQVGASPQGGLDVTVTAPVVDAGPISRRMPGLAGRVVLVDETSSAARDQQVQWAAESRAAAVVLLRADSEYPRMTSASSPTLVRAQRIPVVGVAQSQKARLREALAAGPLTLTVATTSHRGLTSHNVLARRPGRRPDGPVVMVSAHYDSVIGAPGANDDASGTALSLELARAFSRLPATAEVQVGLWGSEEQGLIGSRYHVAQLDQPARDRIVAVFQNDMVATSWDPATRYWLLSYDGLDNAATSAVAGAAARLGYAPRTSPVTERGASDHQSFQEVGIASANFSWRGEESPALLEPPYHSPMDTIAHNVSLERLQVSLELVGCAMWSLARP